MVNKSLTYMDFIQQTIKANNGLNNDFSSYQKKDLISELLLKLTNSYSYLIDYRTGGYIYFSEAFKDVCDYPVNILRKEGVKHYTGLIHKEDWKIIDQSVFILILKFLTTIQKDPSKYRFIFNYRIKKPDGKFLNIRQINNFLKNDAHGKPLMNEGICTVIPYPIPNYKITYIAQTLNKYLMWENEDVKTFLPGSDVKESLSPTEIKVLHWIKNGYSSEKIADKLNRSLHTVKTHRRNMLEKTRCRNTAELLQFSLYEGLI